MDRLCFFIAPLQPCFSKARYNKTSSGDVVANSVAEVVKTFENLGESKLLTSSATQLNGSPQLNSVKSTPKGMRCVCPMMTCTNN